MSCVGASYVQSMYSLHLLRRQNLRELVATFVYIWYKLIYYALMLHSALHLLRVVWYWWQFTGFKFYVACKCVCLSSGTLTNIVNYYDYDTLQLMSLHIQSWERTVLMSSEIIMLELKLCRLSATYCFQWKTAHCDPWQCNFFIYDDNCSKY